MYQVFLADDEPWVLISLKNLIDWGSCGFAVCGEATDGEKAWERIQRMKPDLIVSDIRMPAIDGIELIRRVREAQLSAEVVIVSGYSDFEYARSGLKYGCSDYLLKPVDEEELEACVKRVRESLDRRSGAGQKRDEEEPGYQSEGQTVRRLLQYLQEHYQEVTQQQLAELAGVSPSAVSQMIRRKTGKSYSEYLLEIRIQKAQEYLRRTNQSIEEVASAVGYHDYFYFLKVFKKATGISPSAYRRGL